MEYQNIRNKLIAVPKDQVITPAGKLDRVKQDATLWPLKGGVKHYKGWALCDGSSYDASVFPELDTALGGAGVLPNGPFRTKVLTDSDITINTTGSADGITLARIYAYSDNAGNWRLAGSIRNLDTVAGSGGASFEIVGVTFGNGDGVSNQKVDAGATDSSGNSSDHTVTLARATQGGGVISLASTSTINRWRVSFDVALESKPTWADANLEDYPIIATADNVLSSSIGLPTADKDTAGLVTLDQVAESGHNYISNANFHYWQRGTSHSTNGYGSVDRWARSTLGTTGSMEQQAFVAGQSDVPENPKYFMRNIVTSVAGVSNYSFTVQKIEGVETLAGKTATVGFWAKADAPKNISIDLRQDFGTGGSPSVAINEIGVKKFTLSTDWQYFTHTFSIPDISGKTLGTDGNDYLALHFWFEAGDNWNTRTDTLGQQSGIFDIANVKLEEGTEATKFVLREKTLDRELLHCQRYYFNHSSRIVNSLIADASGRRIYLPSKFAVEMRATPAITVTQTNATNTTGLGAQVVTKNGFYIEASTNGAGYSIYAATYTADAEI